MTGTVTGASMRHTGLLRRCGTANFTRIYTSECPAGSQPVWRFFDWEVQTPSTSTFEVYAESSDDISTFHAVPPGPGAVSVPNVVQVAVVTGAAISGWVGQDVGARLKAAGLPQRKHLQITLRLIPDVKRPSTPIVARWRQAYSCPPAE